MFRASLATLACTVVCFSSGAADSFLFVSKEVPPASRVTEEVTTIEAKNGRITALLGNLPIQGSASALIRDRLTRTRKNDSEQHIAFHECTRDISFSFSKNSPAAAKSNPGRLAGRALHATREADGSWRYEMDASKPTDDKRNGAATKSAEKTAIQQFAAFQIAVDSLSKLYGDEPREIGKPWRPDFSAISKKYPVTIFVDCRLDEVAERDGDKIARITIGGLATGHYEKNRIEVRFTGSILRSLRDQFEPSVELTGTLKFEGNLGKTDKDQKNSASARGQTAIVEVPLTLTRNLKVTSRSN